MSWASIRLDEDHEVTLSRDIVLLDLDGWTREWISTAGIAFCPAVSGARVAWRDNGVDIQSLDLTTGAPTLVLHDLATGAETTIPGTIGSRYDISGNRLTVPAAVPPPTC